VAIFRAFNGTILGEEDVARLFEFNSRGNFVDISETSLDIAETGEVNIASSDPVILGGLNLADGVTLTLDEDGSAGRVSFNGEISVGDSPGTGMIDNIGGSAFGLADGVVINWEKIGTSTDLLHILGDLELSDGFGNISTGTIAVSGGGILDAKEIIIQVDGDTLGVPGQPFELTNWTVTGAPGYTAGIDAEGNLVITGEVIPEPSSIAIAVLAAVGCCFAYRRRKNA